MMKKDSRRRALWQGPHWIRTEKRVAIYERDEWKCIYCQGVPKRYTLDHITPVARGGSNCATNLVTACSVCNEKRGSKPVSVFIARLADEGHDPIAIASRIRSIKKTKNVVAIRARELRTKKSQNQRRAS